MNDRTWGSFFFGFIAGAAMNSIRRFAFGRHAGHPLRLWFECGLGKTRIKFRLEQLTLYGLPITTAVQVIGKRGLFYWYARYFDLPDLWIRHEKFRCMLNHRIFGAMRCQQR